MTKEPYKTVVAVDFTKVEALRGHLHLNQRHMAKALGVSRMTYQSWVRGQRIRKSNEDKVKLALRQLIDLLREEEWPPEGFMQMKSDQLYERLLEILEERS